MRIGHGYDVHRLVTGRQLIIGGVEIPYPFGLLGHSDADVLVHAIMDALLGAMAFGDIGALFPDTDERYKGISSLKLLGKVKTLMDENGYKLINLDATVIAQRPKLSPFIERMKSCIADILQVSDGYINIKATTEEGLGFTGNSEGIAAHAVVLLEDI